ncbi:MAG: membrane or secreted protein [Flavobacteriales bacterium]|jgi:hypothetical protein|tara:strand:- start:2037 stop:2744 length:708 start_codon:yes stop_codon:yes gene_type:complete
MKKTLLLLIFTQLSISINAQSFVGAWERYHNSEKGEELKSIVIFSDGYQAISTYNAKTGKFIYSNGGTWKLIGNSITEKVEFDTDNPERVGLEVTFKVEITDSSMRIVGSEMEFQRVDNGKPGELNGAWLMSGRIRDGEKQLRDTDRPRKTMKILSGTRFQWIAYNTETKKFMGTGGGTYTTTDGKYSENIEFFSKDGSKAGLSLEFNYELINNEWHHKGLSSKGDTINETWTLR